MHVLISFHVAIDETGRQFKDNYLTNTRIVNMALRATLNELPEKGELSRKLSSKQFFIGTVSWIYIQFFASDAKEKCNDFEKISSVLKILRLSESIKFQKFNHLCI